MNLEKFIWERKKLNDELEQGTITPETYHTRLEALRIRYLGKR